LISTHRNHLNLLTFPTRRSSDLAAAPGPAPALATAAGPSPTAPVAVPWWRVPATAGPDATTATVRRCRPTGRPGTTGGSRSAGPDRKSTRLNSSHVKISYAVFCL